MMMVMKVKLAFGGNDCVSDVIYRGGDLDWTREGNTMREMDLNGSGFINFSKTRLLGLAQVHNTTSIYSIRQIHDIGFFFFPQEKMERLFQCICFFGFSSCFFCALVFILYYPFYFILLFIPPKGN